MRHAESFFEQTAQIASRIDHEGVERLVSELVSLRTRGGRLFLLGVGGSAANCSHAVNDFRKICGIEAYTPVDNVSELTARTNDDGWDTVFASWLRVSRAGSKDAVLIFSVGGGSLERNVSANIVQGIEEARRRGLRVLGVVGRDGGHTRQVGDEVLLIPVVDSDRVTPHTEAFQAVVWHCLVSHPKLQINAAHWESLANA
jgi:D-sedoheptulose 7-phosphate isomerase